jgi:hypothetical protein
LFDHLCRDFTHDRSTNARTYSSANYGEQSLTSG